MTFKEKVGLFSLIKSLGAIKNEHYEEEKKICFDSLIFTSFDPLGKKKSRVFQAEFAYLCHALLKSWKFRLTTSE